MNLTHSVAVITGGANGIGRACALAFADAGAAVVVADLDDAALARAVNAIEALGRRGLAVRCDVTNDDDIAKLAERAFATFGHVDLVMLNAGIAIGGRWERIPVAEWPRLLDVNVLGVVRGLNAFLPHLLERSSGHVVITTLASTCGTDSSARTPRRSTRSPAWRARRRSTCVRKASA